MLKYCGTIIHLIEAIKVATLLEIWIMTYTGMGVL